MVYVEHSRGYHLHGNISVSDGVEQYGAYTDYLGVSYLIKI